MKDILFITSFRNINRESWSSIPRTPQDYCSFFYKYASKIKYNLIVFVSDEIKEYLLKNFTFKENIIFLNNDCIETFYHKYLNLEREIINSSKFKSMIPVHRKSAVPTIYPDYNLVNHSKINYVNKAKKLYPDYKFYAWIDFGIHRLLYNSKLYNYIDIEKLPKKIIYQHIEGNIPIAARGKLPIKDNSTTPQSILASHVVHFAGSIFLVHNTLVEKYEELYEKKLKELHNLYVVDDDQKIVLQIFLDNPEYFYMPNSIDFPELNIPLGLDEWFKLLEFF